MSHGSTLALQICPKLFDFLLQYANGYGRAVNNEGGADPRVIDDGSGSNGCGPENRLGEDEFSHDYLDGWTRPSYTAR